MHNSSCPKCGVTFSGSAKTCNSCGARRTRKKGEGHGIYKMEWMEGGYTYYYTQREREREREKKKSQLTYPFFSLPGAKKVLSRLDGDSHFQKPKTKYQYSVD
ncbi:hypothetical protein GGR50DRAFT_683814 [Xylaria sp. CBS 124048]|nr:hypothetical protein GGR50DRAFT_683814 [Xylaria sp. CBS 124048]